MIYLIGSLRNPEVPKIAARLRSEGLEVFDDWYAAGPEADDKWRDYEIGRGRTYLQAIQGLAAEHVFEFDKYHLDSATAVILVLPAGKSGHLELGYGIGQWKPSYILLDNPDRWDVMYRFARMVTDNIDEIIEDVKICQKYTTNDTETPQQMQFTWDDPVAGVIPTLLDTASYVLKPTGVVKL